MSFFPNSGFMWCHILIGSWRAKQDFPHLPTSYFYQVRTYVVRQFNLCLIEDAYYVQAR